MSKGLGNLQKSVLNYLQHKGEPCWFIDMAFELNDQQPITRSFDVSLRRAIHSLEQKGLICCGEGNPKYQRDTTKRLMCWMPEQIPPELKKPLPRVMVENAVIAQLRERGKPIYYSTLLSDTCYTKLRIDPRYEQRVDIAVRRAIKRLTERGIIRLEGTDFNSFKCCLVDLSLQSNT